MRHRESFPIKIIVIFRVFCFSFLGDSIILHFGWREKKITEILYLWLLKSLLKVLQCTFWCSCKQMAPAECMGEIRLRFSFEQSLHFATSYCEVIYTQEMLFTGWNPSLWIPLYEWSSRIGPLYVCLCVLNLVLCLWYLTFYSKVFHSLTASLVDLVPRVPFWQLIPQAKPHTPGMWDEVTYQDLKSLSLNTLLLQRRLPFPY